jgi:CDP-diacylglycerol--inositol 3-phosphatidyltransferase
MKWVKTPIGLAHPSLSRLTWPEAIALASFWVFLLKNIINFVQLWKASKILVGVDLAERAKAREASPKSKGR